MGGLFGSPSPRAQHTAAEWRKLIQSGQVGTNIFNPPPTADQILPEAPPTPDLTDDEIQKARAAAVRRQLMGQGLSSNFLTGSLGDLTAPTTSKSTLGGL